MEGKLPKVDLAANLATAFQGLFLLAKFGTKMPHWELSEGEARDLGEAWAPLLKQLPKKRTKQLEKMLAKYTPILTAGYVTYVITEPRITATRELIALRRLELEARMREQQNGNGNGNGNGPTHYRGVNLGDVTTRFGAQPLAADDGASHAQ